MQELLGNAEIRFGHQPTPVSITLDLPRGLLRVHPPSTLNKLELHFHSVSESFYLQNATFETAIGTLYANRLGPFFANYAFFEKAPNYALDTSQLGHILIQNIATPTISQIILTPKNSRIDFEIKTRSRISGSEIYFYCPFTRQIELEIVALTMPVSIQSLHIGSHSWDYLVASCDQPGLELILSELRIALSLLLRRNVFPQAIRNASKVTFNLSAPGKTTTLGHLVDKQYLNSALEDLIAYVGSCAAGTKDPSHHFLIEAYSNSSTIEVRLLNAFVYLEIIDGSRTLSANQLAKKLRISRENADLIVGIRHAMIHKGMGIVNALIAACEAKKTKGAAKAPDTLDQIRNTSSPHGIFYMALVDLLSLNLAENAGIPIERIRLQSPVSFRR